MSNLAYTNGEAISQDDTGQQEAMTPQMQEMTMMMQQMLQGQTQQGGICERCVIS